MVDQSGRRRLRALRRLRPSHRDSIAVAVAQFAITGLLAVVIVGLVGVALLRRVGNAEARRNAQQLTALAGDGIVAPVIGPGLEVGNRSALSVLDEIVRSRVLRDPVLRVKVWDASGRVLYSDEPRLIGQRFQLEGDELGALRTRGSLSQISDLTKPENRYERRDRQLLEVYHGIRRGPGPALLRRGFLGAGKRRWPSTRHCTSSTPGSPVSLGYSRSERRRLRLRDPRRHALAIRTARPTGRDDQARVGEREGCRVLPRSQLVGTGLAPLAVWRSWTRSRGGVATAPVLAPPCSPRAGAEQSARGAASQ